MRLPWVHCTTLAIMNKPIPVIHYMIAVAGGKDIPCVPYATFGTPALSDYVAKGIANRKALLMHHHGMIAAEASLGKALWLAQEVETLAQMYLMILQAGDNVPILPDEEMSVVQKKFQNYGLRQK